VTHSLGSFATATARLRPPPPGRVRPLIHWGTDPESAASATDHFFLEEARRP
jgi:hypothetical protein